MVNPKVTINVRKPDQRNIGVLDNNLVSVENSVTNKGLVIFTHNGEDLFEIDGVTLISALEFLAGEGGYR